MHTVTVSPKFQVVIPKELRERLKLKPGQKLLMFEREGRLFLFPPRPVTELRGIAKGLKWDYEKDRDHTERF